MKMHGLALLSVLCMTLALCTATRPTPYYGTSPIYATGPSYATSFATSPAVGYGYPSFATTGSGAGGGIIGAIYPLISLIIFLRILTSIFGGGGWGNNRGDYGGYGGNSGGYGGNSGGYGGNSGGYGGYAGGGNSGGGNSGGGNSGGYGGNSVYAGHRGGYYG